ncbi:cytochrome P460 family protein [Bradyrhizobium sp. Leo121]|uniref:cytochrome P460 family protein n=1 Tax=Bradyrhizobium sp. Leo121 TaxID=1571195 RepID=UPI001FE1C632|nr:cytochrome P460 family protein [Bradyrhizobium sp. Leo121]
MVGEKKGRRLTLLIAGAVSSAVGRTAVFAQSESNNIGAPTRKRCLPEYTASGDLILPENFNEWVFVGSPVTPNALNGGKANFPEFHNVYIKPGSYEIYKKTGEFPEGTIFFKELQLTLPAENPDGSRTEASRRGFFPGKLNGADVSVRIASATTTLEAGVTITSITTSRRLRQPSCGRSPNARSATWLALRKTTSGPNSIRCWTNEIVNERYRFANTGCRWHEMSNGLSSLEHIQQRDK